MAKIKQRIGEEKYNNQGCLMKIVEYNHSRDMVVEFQDVFKGKVHVNYENFSSGRVRNPYLPNVYGVGITGNKYKAKINDELVKEYLTWKTMLKRCFDKKYKETHPTYDDVTCCKEWLLYENFYEWLHSQPNFDKWYNNEDWHLDKDILIKNNKIYSPETCCLVSQNINSLFLKNQSRRGSFPIGVAKIERGFQAKCRNPFIKWKLEALGTYSTPQKAFKAYKKRKEFYIKQMAKTEYEAGNITKSCYEAMMCYEVEITD